MIRLVDSRAESQTGCSAYLNCRGGICDNGNTEVLVPHLENCSSCHVGGGMCVRRTGKLLEEYILTDSGVDIHSQFTGCNVCGGKGCCAFLKWSLKQSVTRDHCGNTYTGKRVRQTFKIEVVVILTVRGGRGRYYLSYTIGLGCIKTIRKGKLSHVVATVDLVKRILGYGYHASRITCAYYVSEIIAISGYVYVLGVSHNTACRVRYINSSALPQYSIRAP